MNIKTGTEWRFTSPIQKIEPEPEKTAHEWNTLWKKIKNQSRAKCTSQKRNREIATLIKCLNEKLSVLKTILQRRPDIYKSSCCIVCNEGEEEDQEHLARCKTHEKGWKETEDTTINLAWIALSEETQTKTSKEDLKKCIWGASNEEKKESRARFMKGLVQEKVREMLQSLTNSIGEIKNFLKVIINTAWNGFFENI